MGWDRVEGNWKQVKGIAQKQWGKLTDSDLDVIAGRQEELAGRIQARYGIEKEEAQRQIAEWMKEPGALDDWNDTKPILDM